MTEWNALSLIARLRALVEEDKQVFNYKILLCADSVIPPSPWTDKFRVEVDHFHKVVRITGDLT